MNINIIHSFCLFSVSWQKLPIGPSCRKFYSCHSNRCESGIMKISFCRQKMKTSARTEKLTQINSTRYAAVINWKRVQLDTTKFTIILVLHNTGNEVRPCFPLTDCLILYTNSDYSFSSEHLNYCAFVLLQFKVLRC